MMDYAKYLIISKEGVEIPVIFSDLIQHVSIIPNGYEAVSGGFVQIYTYDNGEVAVCCFGQSVSAGVKSREEHDAEIIERHILKKRTEDYI